MRKPHRLTRPPIDRAARSQGPIVARAHRRTPSFEFLSVTAGPGPSSGDISNAANKNGGAGASKQRTRNTLKLNELGNSRARRVKRAAAFATRRTTFDLLEGPSRRVGRRTTRRGASGGAGDMRDARDPLLGMLDDLGDRVGRRGSHGRAGAPPPPCASASASAHETSSSSFDDERDGDLFESPGGRVRRSANHRAVRAFAKSGGAPTAPPTASACKMNDEAALGILSGPSDRCGRSNECKKEKAGRDDARGGRAEPHVAAKPLLGILSGPGKRVGRKHRRENPSVRAR